MKNVESIFPLTPMQQGMLFHALFSPGSGVYIEQSHWTLHGDIQPHALEQAWQTVIDRHQVLRAAIVWEGLEKPLQIVGQIVKLHIQQHDWRMIPLEQQRRQFQTFLKSDREKPFAFVSAPLMRLNLFRMKDDNYKIVWTHHHILLDGWSASLVLNEVFAVYRAICRHEQIQLEPVRPYQDYVAWLARQNVNAAQAYWRERLKGFDSPTRVSRNSSVKNSHAAATTGEFHIYLSKEKTAVLGRYAKELRITTSTLVQASWALLLSHWSSTQDIVFGVTVSGRPPDLEGVERMVGLFINTLPLRVSVDPKLKIATWLKEIQEQQLQMKQFEYSPLVDVQRLSEIAPADALFETILVFENYPVNESLDQFESEDSHASSGSMQSYERQHYPLILAARQGERLGLGLVYAQEEFAADTAKRMLTQLEQILTDLPRQQYVGELTLLTPAEERRLLVEWNQTARLESQPSVQELFEKQVAMHPEALAIQCGRETLDYMELNRRANQLAHYLTRLGVGPDSIVGICIERSIDMLVGVLAILKAGGAYLPLDPEYPRERLELMLADSGAKLLLTRHTITEELPWPGLKVVHLDTDWPLIELESDANPAIRISPDNLAYVIYTSGSTGRPKGVAMPHRALINLLHWQINRSGSRSQPRTLQFTSLGFDVSFQEIFSTCCVGGTLVFVSEETRRDPTLLLRIINEGRIERLFLPFVALESLARESKQQRIVPSSLREVITAGEQLKITGDVRDLFVNLPSCSLDNQYGPTESHVVSAHLLSAPAKDWPELPPIGRPLWNTQLYVLDVFHKPSAVGVIGDLYVGGTCLARGYLNQPAMTAEKFLPDPFTTQPGARLYKTGDLARYLPDGSLEFIGRSDHQVKVRGYRIELGEIESVLLKHEAVHEAVVLVRDDAGEKNLVAYVVPDTENQRPNGELVGQLREYLRKKLPPYAVPQLFVVLDQIPRTLNGKINRKELPEPNHGRSETLQRYVAPRDELERELVGIWEESLNMRPIGIQDNFFEIGGHSLRALVILGKIQKRFGRELPVSLFFPRIDVETLADVLRGQPEATTRSLVLKIQPQGDAPPFFCVHPSTGFAFHFAPLAQHLGSRQPFYGLQALGLDQDVEPLSNPKEMAGRYLEAIREIQPRGPYLIGGASMGGRVAFEMAQQLKQNGEDLALLVLFDSGMEEDDGRPTRTELERVDDATILASALKGYFSLPVEQLREMDTDEQALYILEQGKKIEMFPPEFGVSHFRRLLKVFKANAVAWISYIPQPYDGKIILFRAEEQSEEMSSEPFLGWERLAPGRIEVQEVPGNHISMFREPHVRALARRLEACIAAALSEKYHYTEKISHAGK